MRVAKRPSTSRFAPCSSRAGGERARAPLALGSYEGHIDSNLKSAYINGENFIVTSIFNFFLGALAPAPPYIASPPVPVAPNSNPFSMPAWLHQARSLGVGKKN